MSVSLLGVFVTSCDVFTNEDFEGFAGSVGVEEKLGGRVFGCGGGVLENEVSLGL